MEEYFGGLLDILVNNVGTNIRKATVDYTPEEFAHVMDTNFTSLFLLTKVRKWLSFSAMWRLYLSQLLLCVYCWSNRGPQRECSTALYPHKQEQHSSVLGVDEVFDIFGTQGM